VALNQNKVILTTVNNLFYAQVLAARLTSEGCECIISTPTSALTPFPINIDIMVGADDLSKAREILLFDSVEAIFYAEPTQKMAKKYSLKKWWLAKRLNNK